MGLIGDIYYSFRGDGARLQKDAQVEGAKAGTTGGTSFAEGFRKSWTGANIGKGLVTGLGLAGGLGAANAVASGLGAVEGAITDTVGKAIDFEKAMQNVNSITKTTDADLHSMGERVLKLAGDFGQSATTMAEGLYDISSSGFQGADALTVLEAATKAATAGLATAKQASAGLVGVLNAYGKKAGDAADVSDVLFQTVNRGVISFPELSDQIGKTTALAAPLGVSLEEVAAATALMTRNGVGAEETFTQINAVMNSMLMPSKQATELAADLGLKWDAAALKANGLSGQMTALVKATNGSADKMATLLGDTRAVRGAFVLAKNSGADLNTELGIMQKSSGATASAFEEQSKSTAFHIDQMNAKIEAAQVELGEKLLPLVADLADAVTDNVVPALGRFTDALGDVKDAAKDNEDPLVNLANLIHDVFKDPKEDARTAFGSMFDGLNDLQSALDDAAASGNDFWTFWDDHSSRADRELSKNISSMETQAGKMADDLAGPTNGFIDLADRAQDSGRLTAGALDKIGDHAGSMAKDVKTATEQAAIDTQTLATAAATAATKMIDDYFDPIERKAAAFADHETTRAAIKTRQAAKSKKEIRDSKEALIEAVDAEATGLAKLGDKGELTAKQVDTFQSDVTASYKALGQKVPPKIQKIIDKLRNLYILTTKDYSIQVKANIATSGNRERATGGPVTAGVPYIVGEKRAELFVPESDGRIIPRVPSMATAAASAPPVSDGGITVNLLDRMEVRSVRDISDGLRILERRGYLKRRR